MQGSFIQGFAYSTQSLFESWFEKLSLSAGIGAVVGFFRIDIVLVYAMFAMMTADYVLGWMDAKKAGTWDIRVARHGCIKFVSYFLWVLLVCVVNMTLSRVFQCNLPFIHLFVGWIVLCDAGSVMRHLENLGFKVPSLLFLITKRGKRQLETYIAGELKDNNHGEER